MDTTHAQIREIVMAAIAAINEELPDPDKITATDETPLTGEGSTLDSLRLINLVVFVEDAIEQNFGREVVLSDSPALFEEDGPLVSVGEFIHFVSGLVDNGTA
jgi:acyl carrier protein